MVYFAINDTRNKVQGASGSDCSEDFERSNTLSSAVILKSPWHVRTPVWLKLLQ